MGDTMLVEYRGRIVGLVEPLDPGWGLNAINIKSEVNASEEEEGDGGQELRPLVNNTTGSAVC